MYIVHVKYSSVKTQCTSTNVHVRYLLCRNYGEMYIHMYQYMYKCSSHIIHFKGKPRKTFDLWLSNCHATYWYVSTFTNYVTLNILKHRCTSIINSVPYRLQWKSAGALAFLLVL